MVKGFTLRQCVYSTSDLNTVITVNHGVFLIMRERFFLLSLKPKEKNQFGKKLNYLLPRQALFALLFYGKLALNSE